MKKSWLADAAIGLVLTLIVAAGYLFPGAPGLGFFEGAELKTYDRRAQLRTRVGAGPEIVIVGIDDASIAQLGRWPFPRARVADLLDKLREKGRPKVIGLDVLYSEADQNQGLLELQGLQKEYEGLLAARKIVDKTKAFDAQFSSAAVRLDNDTKLLAALKASGNVLLPMAFNKSVLLGAKPEELPPVFSSDTVSVALAQGYPETALPDGTRAIYPIVPLAEAALGVGHVVVDQDQDGVVRREWPVLKYGDGRYPSFALLLAASYLGVKPNEIVWAPGRKVSVGKIDVPLDAEGRMLVSFDGPEGTFSAYSFADVLNDKVSPDVFKDKIVLVGLTATGVGSNYTTPVAAALPGVELVANVLENVLHKRFLVRPEFAFKLEAGLIAFVGLFLMVGLPRLKALWGFLAFLILELALLAGGTYLFINGQWLKVAYPGVLLLGGYTLIVTRRFFSTEKGKELVEASAIETNKMLGLSFQGQGMLDMAFEKFRLCPLDENMKETLYNLALDFERKRQFSKAGSVLQHVADKDPKYKDVVEKAAKLKAASEGAVFGGVGGPKKEGTVMLSGGSAKPTLGRYEIEKELGRGAMGIVYLGKDPKINRQVAIKTMMLEEGSDANEAKAVKERFFREAESAGTLNHPNIVRIFDAGEEQDIAFIAMELLDGHDFLRYTTKAGQMPIEKVLEAVATVADALDYAHAQGIVHRDIKPANFMLLKDGTIRVADFGIARITASSKTATGTVMGTPSYMSPEAVSGKKVDGRSDLFSLTVALFELLVGEKPFKGGDNIGTLVFQIANDPHPDPASLRADLPACIKSIIDKGLAKNPDDRYPRGSAMAAALRHALALIKAGDPSAQPAPPAAPAPELAVETAAAAPLTLEAPTTVPAEASAPTLTSTADDVLASLATVSMQAPDPEPTRPPTAEITVPGLDITVPSVQTFEAVELEATMTISPLEEAVVSAPEPDVPSLQTSADATITLTIPPEGK